MLVLYETALGFCLFKLTDTAKLESADLWEEFESPEKANKLYVCPSTLVKPFPLACSELDFRQKVETSRFASVYLDRDCS